MIGLGGVVHVCVCLHVWGFMIVINKVQSKIAFGPGNSVAVKPLHNTTESHGWKGALSWEQACSYSSCLQV